jgi:hypothetical protein
MAINTGWTPTEKKICIRCGDEVDSTLFMLCDACHQEDAEMDPDCSYDDTFHDEDIDIDDYTDLQRTLSDALDVAVQ